MFWLLIVAAVADILNFLFFGNPVILLLAAICLFSAWRIRGEK